MAIGKTNSAGGKSTSDATAIASDILIGKTAYGAEGKIIGTIPTKVAATYTPTTSNQTIASSQYLAGSQTISGDADLVATNIKSGVSIFNVTGTFTDDANATAGDILSDKTVYVSGTKITGAITTNTASNLSTSGSTVTAAAGYYSAATSKNIAAGSATTPATTITVTPTISINSSIGLITVTNSSTKSITPTVTSGYVTTGIAGTITINGSATNQLTSKAKATYYPSTANRTIAAGTYLVSAQDIGRVITSNITVDTVKTGVTVKVGDAGSASRILQVTGTYTNDGDVTAEDMVSGKTAYVNGTKITGTILSAAGGTFVNVTSNRVILSSGRYITTSAIIRGTTTSNLTAENIKAGVTVKVGDAGSSGRIANVTGTFTDDATATAADILQSKIGYVNGAKITGTVTNKASATYYTSTANQTIAAGQYLTGVQTIKSVTTANITAANIKVSAVVTVGDAGSATRIKNITGTYTSDGTATAADIASGKTAYVNGTKITGTMSSKAAATINTSTADQTIASKQYLAGAQTIRAVTTTNLTAANVKVSAVLTVGDASSATRIANITGTYTSDGTAAAADIVASKTAYVNGAKITGTITTQAGKTVTPGTTTVTAVASQRYCSGSIIVAGSANLVASNIKGGVTIFGVTGTLSAVTGTYTKSTSTSTVMVVTLASSISLSASGTFTGTATFS